MKEKGYRVIAPFLVEGVILLREAEGDYKFPEGIREIQGRGFYRTEAGEKGRFFEYTHGFNSAKEFLHPPSEVLIKLTPYLKQEVYIKNEKIAFLGLRHCDIRAINILDGVFLEKNTLQDTYYKSKRERIFTLVVNCNVPSENCFCTSMGGSPFSEEGDIIVTELKDGFLLRVKTPEGEEIIEGLEKKEADDLHLEEERYLKERAERKIKKLWEKEEIYGELLKKIESPVWYEIEKRCLACGCCAMVCPTCFCYEVIDDISLDFSESVRSRRWDVCFREEFSAVHGVPLRASIKARYRQWLMHKFSYWVGQFGEYGCVGCGRCITWCTVGIDIREEVKKLLDHKNSLPIS